MAHLREAAPAPAEVVDLDQAAPTPMAARAQRVTPPSFREIRSGRAAAAARAPIAQVQVPVEELDAGTLLADARSHVAPQSTPPVAMVLPGMEQLVERVRQRTAARLSRSGSFSPA